MNKIKDNCKVRIVFECDKENKGYVSRMEGRFTGILTALATLLYRVEKENNDTDINVLDIFIQGYEEIKKMSEE